MMSITLELLVYRSRLFKIARPSSNKYFRCLSFESVKHVLFCLYCRSNLLLVAAYCTMTIVIIVDIELDDYVV